MRGSMRGAIDNHEKLLDARMDADRLRQEFKVEKNLKVFKRPPAQPSESDDPVTQKVQTPPTAKEKAERH